ncbi:hypothetical protein [uncultured Serinicoccus sp.]|uniref:hypothetical protein n=1 Tax=uncultured Serinicoccus sp. TaxID=735514 RepID=UPI002629A83A|nr:hypothetical protein [uncultured Serinicoccus sp.]
MSTSAVPGRIPPKPMTALGRAREVIRLVAARLSDVDGWAEVASAQSPTLVVIDQAVDLRRTLADAAYLARSVLEDVPTAHAWIETRLAAAAVASLLDAAGHTVSPVATALCRQDDLHGTAQLSAGMTRRFLMAASAAAADLRGLLEHASPAAGPGRQHLWAVP